MRRPSLPLALGLLALGVLAARPAAAQAADSSEAVRFRLAETLLRGGQTDDAIAVLEDLHARRPTAFAYRQKLGEAYRAGRRYADALELLDLQRAREGATPALDADRAALRYALGDSLTAFAAWDAVVAEDPRDALRVRTVAAAMAEAGAPRRALALLDAARPRVADPAALDRDAARLAARAGDLRRAADAYLDVLAADPQQLGFVRSELDRLAEDHDAALPLLVEAASARARRTPTNRPLRELLAGLALQAGDARRALDETRAVDRLDREEGRVLMLFARTAADAGAFETAAEAYADVLARYPDGPAAAEARLGLGLLHERWADAAAEPGAAPGTHAARALDAFRAFVGAHPGHPSVPDARRRTGRLLLDAAGDAAAARAVLDSVIATAPRAPAAEEAAFDLGRVSLRAGDLDGAALAFDRLEERLRTGDLADRARFERALLDLYRGDLDAALARAEVLAENASADVANDAIALQLLLVENRTDSLGLPLARYARATLLLRRGQGAAARDSLDALLTALAAPDARTGGPHPLLDDARRARADVFLSLGQPAEAARALEEIARDFPDSYLADRALYDLAGLQERALNDPTAAAATLRRLLDAFPASLLAPDARRTLRRLQPPTNGS